MKTRWKTVLGMGGAAAAAWLGSEMCESGDEKPARPPVADTDAGNDKIADISHAVRDLIRKPEDSRPKSHFVPPIPPLNPSGIEPQTDGPSNLADHSGTTGGVDQATRDAILETIFAQQRCEKEAGAAYEECRDEVRKRIEAEQDPRKRTDMMGEYLGGNSPECAEIQHRTESDCTQRTQGKGKRETTEQYFIAQYAAQLAALQNAVANGTPIESWDVQNRLHGIWAVVTAPNIAGIFLEEEEKDPVLVLRTILNAAGVSTREFVSMLNTLESDYIPPDEKEKSKQGEWNPAVEPPPADPAYARQLIDRLRDFAEEAE